jgi:tRNA(fMet)-specific endonuclease VapC
MGYLIDTDISIDHLLNDADAVALLARLAQEGISISVITYLELYEGWLREPEGTSASMLQQYVSSIPIVIVSEAIARRCAFLRRTLSSQGKRVRQRSLDLLIAATAIGHDLTLVTRNRHDYHDIPGLILFENRLPPGQPDRIDHLIGSHLKHGH